VLIVNEVGRVLFSMTLDIVEAGEESVKGARRTIRRVSVVRDCSLVCNRMALLSRA
jgi:hypothetical protein